MEVNDGKDNVEVVGWYTLDARNLERIKRQAEREGGELLVLSPKDKVESLPTPTSGLPTDKGSEVGGEKQEAEKKRPAPIAERIEDVGEKIGDARKDVWKEIIARIKNKKQGIEEALKKSSAGKLFSSLFDEKELLESGVSNEVVTFISAVKGSLGTKPRSLSKLKMWINKVLHQYDMCEQALENWESVKKKIDEWKYYSQPFYMYRAAMAVGGYESGRDVGNAELWQIADGYSDGKSVAGQWCVRKAGAYDGIYKTYEEAAEALKKFAGENAAVDGKGKRKEVKLAIYKRRTDGTMFIAPEGKPDVIIQDGFKTLYEASAYKKEHYAEMQERYRTLMDGIKPKFNENRERKGRDWRGGKDVSAEDFREAFDFRGVEFGNWMQQKDRRQALNECYDSLMDLAMVCGVSPKALSLGGKLAMAFGARGGGKFNAHYEPDKVVINLTKTKGAGSLAHEWFHAIDNYFNMQGWDEFATESTRNVERKEMAEAWKDLVRAINGSDYFKRSDKYARLKGSRYWIEPTELGARAFAVWVENRLSKYGTINDYLANNPRLVDEKASDAEKKYAPYPFDKDADWMDEKFGRLFEVMQERVDEETGKHILYSRNKAAGHEKTELTAEERELRDNLVERMRKGGLDVVTDSEEMQRVIDTENERTRMMGAGSVREHRVYHGSGADFDAFDHSHMGEGEGAQAYGWGTYVTEVEGIGRTYAIQNTTKHNDALRALQHDVDAISDQLNRHRDDLKYDEEQLKRANEWRAEAELDYELFRDEAEKLKEKYGEASPKYRNHLFNDIYTDEMKRAQSSVKSMEESIQYRKEKIAELEKALKDKQAEIDELPKEFPRHLYTVEIPDDNGSNYLDWNGHPAESLLKDVGSFLESEGFERVQDNPVRYEKGESTVVLNPNATGADLYAELREALGSDKKASQALAELGCIGIKYPADNMRGGRKDGAKNYVIFNENDAKITDHTRFLRTAGGEVYGLVKDGRIYLDPKVATSETAVHEYTHLWGDMLRRKDSEQWSHTVKELKNSVLWEEVKESYPELKTDDEIADEVLSTFSGRRGAERLREEARRVADGEGGVFTKAKAIETLERVKEAIARFWEGVARMFGINRYRSAEELADMAMRDLLDSKNPMKDESGMRKRGEVGETLATSGTYFSGGGLLEAGLKGVIDPKVAVEFSEKIAGVYADNHGNHIVVADVRDVDPKKLVGAVDGGEVQYFHASPVCKNFSKAKREGGEVELDKETALSTAEFIAKTRPKVVTIENVKGYRNSEALKIITDELTRQGYDWDADVYNTADYGGYTKRERLIVRAKRDGKLPPKPEKLPEELRKKGWYSAVEDLIPHLEEKKTGVPQGTDERLKNSGIDYRTIDKPLYVFGRGYANKTVGHAFADELLPTLTTGGGDIIIMPDGRVLKASPRVLARVTGLPDTYKMPETDQLSHTIVGNGIPTQLTEGVIAPLLDNAIPSAERATKRESVFDVADRVSQNLEERTRAMGSRVEKRMADVAQKLEGRELTAEQKAVVDVFSGEKDNQKFSVERNGVKQQFLLKQGQEDKAGAKHSLYRHYGTNTGVITADDVLKIPQVLERGERTEKAKGGKKMAVYTMDVDGAKFTVYTRIGKDYETIDDFYSNKKGSERYVLRNTDGVNNTPEGAHNPDSEPSAKVEDKSESPKLFGEEIIDDGKKGSDSTDRSVRENPKNEDKPRYSRKPGESIFDYASRVSEDVDRSVREIVSARDEYEKKVKSKGFQTKEALQNSMLGLQEFMLAIDHASGNKRYIEDIPDFENPILGENRLSSVNKEEMHQVAKTQFKPLMSAVAKLSGNGKESGELYDYMFAKHGLERDAVMRQREAQKEFDKYQKANPKGTKTIGDFVASLEEKKTGVPQGTDERLKNSGIDYRTIDKPLYVFGRGYANKTVGHAFADELLPTLTTGGGDIIIMPDGRVLKASPRVLARVTGLPDTYKMPETDQLSHTIVGNGIPTQLTEGVIAPLLDNAIPSAERATKRESVFDVADRVSQNLEERTRAMRSDEIDRKYPNWLDGTTTDSGRHSTQVEGTRRTYNKVGDWIEKNIGKDVKILDASSGLGYGTADLKKRGFNIEDVEPYQSEERKKNNPATYSSYDDIPKDYDVIISNAVLNVIPDNWRRDVLHNMADHLKPGGIMFINTRKAGEERSIKDKIELDSPQEVLVKRNGKIASYQRFFAPKELKEWVEKELGNGYEVETANDNNSGTKGLAAVVVKKTDADIDRSVREFNPIELSNEDRQKRGDALRGAEPIDVKIKQIVKTKDMSARKAAEKWWKDNVGASRFYDTEIGLVEINKASVGSSLAHRYSQVKLDAITSLADGFNNAVYLGSMPDFSRQEGVKSHYFAYPINYNGHRNYVFCRAMQDANKNRLYVHEVFLADNIEKGNTLQTAASQPHGGITLYKDILANVLTANVTNNFETSKPRYSRKPGESIFDYASRVSEDVDRSVREIVSARDEYEKKVKSKGFQTKEALQNSMLGLQEFMLAIDHASGNKRYIEDIPDFENPILGENRLSSVNKEESHSRLDAAHSPTPTKGVRKPYLRSYTMIYMTLADIFFPRMYQAPDGFMAVRIQHMEFVIQTDETEFFL